MALRTFRTCCIRATIQLLPGADDLGPFQEPGAARGSSKVARTNARVDCSSRPVELLAGGTGRIGPRWRVCRAGPLESDGWIRFVCARRPSCPFDTTTCQGQHQARLLAVDYERLLAKAAGSCRRGRSV